MMKIGRPLTAKQQQDQILYWRAAQLQASNPDELNTATEKINLLLDEWLQTSAPVGKP